MRYTIEVKASLQNFKSMDALARRVRPRLILNNVPVFSLNFALLLISVRQ